MSCAEFIDAIVQSRKPTVDIYAMNAPGIVAHESAHKGGELLEASTSDHPGAARSLSYNWYTPTATIARKASHRNMSSQRLPASSRGVQR